MIFHWIILWRAAEINYHFKDDSPDHTSHFNGVSVAGSPSSLWPAITKSSCQYHLADIAGCNLHLHCKGNKRLSSLPALPISPPSPRLQGGPELTRCLGRRRGIFLHGFCNSQTTYLKAVARHTLGAALLWIISLFFEWGQHLMTLTKERG